MKTALMASLIFIMGAKCDMYGREKKKFSKRKTIRDQMKGAGIEKKCGSVLQQCECVGVCSFERSSN